MSDKKQTWKEAAWRPSPTETERDRAAQHLSSHPELKGELEEERALTQLLSKLPQVPVSPDFTQRVLAALEPIEPHAAKSNIIAFPEAWSSWIKRVAAVLVAGGVFWFAFSGYQNHRQAELAESVAFISRLTAPSPVNGSSYRVEVLENIDAIQYLDADDALVLALEQ